MGGGGFVAGPAGLAAAPDRTPLVLTEADSHLGLANRLLARRAPGASASPSRSRGARASATWSPAGRCRRRSCDADRAAARAALRHRRPRPLPARRRRQPGRPLDQLRRGRGLRRARRTRLPTSSTSAAGATTRSWRGGSPPRPTATATRCSPTSRRPRRLPRRRRPRARPLRRLDLRAGRGGHGRRSWCPIRTRPPTTRAPTPPGWREAGAATVLADAELGDAAGAERLRAEVAVLLGEPGRLEAMAAASRGAGQARRGAPHRRRGPGGGAMTGERLGPGWDAAAAALHRHRRRRDERPGAGLRPARGDGQRQRPQPTPLIWSGCAQAGLDPVVGHDAANLPGGGGGGRLDRDRRRQPGAGAGPGARRRADPPRRPAGRALRREAADRRRRHPRQDDDDGDGGLGAAGDRRRPRLLRRRRGARARARTAAPPTPAGARASGSSPRPTRATPASSSWGRRSPSSPTSRWTITRAGARWPSCTALSPVPGAAAAAVLPADGGLDGLAAAGAQARLRRRRPRAGRSRPRRARPPQPRQRPRRPGGDRAGRASTSPRLPRRWPTSRACGGGSSSRARAAGTRVYDDYAHHPTEVRAALSALRELEPEHLIAVFQPHLYSRTKALAEEFGAALALADEVVVLDVYPAREQPVGELAGVSGLRVAQAAAERMGGRPVWWLPEAGTARRALAERLDRAQEVGGSSAVLVTIGAGDVFRLGEALVEGARMSSPPAGGRARPPARPPDHRPHRRRRRLVRPPRRARRSWSRCCAGPRRRGWR